jgi:hypothetical protein
MSKLEDDIRNALMEDDQASQDHVEEISYFGEIGELFKGRNRWLTIGAYIEAFLFFGVGVYGIFGILDATDDTSRTIYLLMSIFGFMIAIMIKLWLWIQINRNATVREILRLELRILDIQKALRKK